MTWLSPIKFRNQINYSKLLIQTLAEVFHSFTLDTISCSQEKSFSPLTAWRKHKLPIFINVQFMLKINPINQTSLFLQGLFWILIFTSLAFCCQLGTQLILNTLKKCEKSLVCRHQYGESDTWYTSPWERLNKVGAKLSFNTPSERKKKNLEGCKKIKIQIIENFISVTHSFLFYK